MEISGTGHILGGKDIIQLVLAQITLFQHDLIHRSSALQGFVGHDAWIFRTQYTG